MSLEKKDLLKLMTLAATAEKNSPVAYSFGDEKFSATDLDEAVRVELGALAADYATYRQNQNLIFELVEKTIDEVLPKRVMEQYGQFAEVQTVAQGDKAIYSQRISQASRMRAKQFVTKVGLAGVYEIFKLDGFKVEVETMAYGGAAQIGLEEFLDGRITFADVLDIVLLALDEAVYTEIAKALIAATNNLPAANKVSAGHFDEAAMDSLVAIADAYGQATIYCTYEFATTMVPADGWLSDGMKDTMWNVGYLANYKGHRVIVLPQSYTDDQHTTKVIDPSYAWIIPTGGNDKPVKIAFEGQTLVREAENHDWSKDIHVYKKIGVGTVLSNNLCRYVNTALTTVNYLDDTSNDGATP